MKFIISRPDLASLVGSIQGVVPSKPVTPILSNVLIEAHNGKVILSTTDLKVSIRAQTQANIIEEGAITLSARRFFQLIRELTIPEITLTTSDTNTAYIQAGESRFCFHGIHANTFPIFPTLTHTEHFSISAKKLKEMLVKSAFAAAREDSRHVLNGVLMKIENHNAIFIGADGKRLAKLLTSIELNSDHTHDYLISLKAVEEIIQLIDQEESIEVYLDLDKIGIEGENTFLVTKLLSGKYPDVEHIIPKTSKFTLTLHREELITLLKQMALFTTNKNQPIHFTFTPGELTLTAASIEIGEGKASMAVDYSGELLEISFNPLSFYDILRHSYDEIISLSITDSYSPGLITDSTSALYVIMPMRKLNYQSPAVTANHTS